MWNSSYFDEGVFREALRRERNLLGLDGDELVVVLSRASDATMPRRVHPRNGRPPAYRWTDAIADLSTVDAILSVTKTAEKALEPKWRGILFCAVVTKDVRNAFNSASWSALADALLRLGIPGYLYKISGVTSRIEY